MFGPHQYGGHPALLAQLEVDYADGTTQRVTSDTGWSASTGPVVTADLLDGERYDARRETPGWTSPGFDDGDWLRAGEADEALPPQIVAQADPRYGSPRN